MYNFVHIDDTVHVLLFCLSIEIIVHCMPFESDHEFALNHKINAYYSERANLIGLNKTSQ